MKALELIEDLIWHSTVLFLLFSPVTFTILRLMGVYNFKYDVFVLVTFSLISFAVFKTVSGK